MRYKVHSIDVKQKNIQDRLENYLNMLQGEVVAVLPNVVPKFHLMGATGTVDSLLIVEKLE